MNDFSQKENFVTQQLVDILKDAEPSTPGLWGKMNLTQMVEHVTDFFKVSAGTLQFPLVTPEDLLPKFKAFLLSDKIFRENTQAPPSIVSEEPNPVRSLNYEEAIINLKEAIQHFEEQLKFNEEILTVHPVFGALNYSEWILLHYKHVQHHLKQFGLLA